ncbi:MAG: NUDIX domain-containing protein [Epsilonproteobacteria bacterium]|nr:NUDIX domain-containing protein [Campylobacterota bacterium]
MSEQIILRARALIVDNGHVLLTRAHKQPSYTYLLGGKVEYGEPIMTALARELGEEMGIHAHIGKFIGCMEHSWNVDSQLVHEINFIFHVIGDNLTSQQTPQSQEEHISFEWVAFDQLKEANILPKTLATYVPVWAEHKDYDYFMSKMKA